MSALRRSFNSYFPLPTRYRAPTVSQKCNLLGSPVRVLPVNLSAFQLLRKDVASGQFQVLMYATRGLTDVACTRICPSEVNR